jgi:hypothetical protein
MLFRPKFDPIYFRPRIPADKVLITSAVPQRRGFGTIVMEAMTERSVDGTVDLDYAASGLTWRLTCPAGKALEGTTKPAATQTAFSGEAQA